jgi:hypothetical protein
MVINDYEKMIKKKKKKKKIIIIKNEDVKFTCSKAHDRL